MSENLESKGLQVFMEEIAQELGVTNYAEMDKRGVPSVVNGYIGGTTSRLLNELGQKMISECSEDEVRELMSRYNLHANEEMIESSKSFMNR